MSNKYNYYPLIDDNNFYKKLLNKTEFFKYYIKNIKDIERNDNPNSDFLLMPHQEFLKNYISINTPYNGILIYHGTGIGKTCTAISIAEGFKHLINNQYERILVILKNDILEENFINNIYNHNKELLKKKDDQIVHCTGTDYIVKSDEPQFKKKIKASIDSIYQFTRYLTFSNYIKDTLLNWNGKLNDITPIMKSIIKQYYSNRVIIIDEVHNIKESTNKDIKAVPSVLEAIITYAENTKLILLSATPMYDKPFEIIFLLNLLLLNDNKEKIKISDVFEKDNITLTKNGALILEQKSKGYISYLRGENPITFPLKIIPKESIIPLPKFNINNDKKINNLKYIQLISCKFNDIQRNFYIKYIQHNQKKISNINILNNSLDIINANEDDISENNVSEDNHKSILSELLQISNIIYPTNKNNIFTYGKNYINSNSSFTEEHNKYLKNKKYISYKFNDCALINNTPFIDESILQNYSTKFYKCLMNIKKSKGIIFIYSYYKAAGVLPLALILEQNGYLPYESKPLLNYNKKKNPICYMCGNLLTNHSKYNKDHSFSPAYYILASGSKDHIKINIAETKNVINSEQNKYGKNIKIILGTQKLSEGIDFHNIRQIHIMEPWYNMSRINQIIGRGLRYGSHKFLPSEEQNVEIFKYASSLNNNSNDQFNFTESIDEHNYRISEKKDIGIKIIEKILKKTSIDCVLNKNVNLFKNLSKKKIISSRGDIIKIDINDNNLFNYKCIYEPTKYIALNSNTYDLVFSKTNLEKIIKKIKYLYKLDYIYDLHDIVNKFNNNIETKYIYFALYELLNFKHIIYDKFNRPGFLLYKNKYYIFQPFEFTYENIPIHYKKTPLTKKIKEHYINIIEYSKNNNDKFNTDDSFIKSLNTHELKLYNKSILEYITYKINFNKNNLLPSKYNDDKYLNIISNIELDKINNHYSIKLLEIIIQKYYKNNNVFDNISDKHIFEYYYNYFIIQNKHIIGYNFFDHIKCYDHKLNSFSDCNEQILYSIKYNNKSISKNKFDESNISSIHGIISHDDKYSFKIINYSKHTSATTLKNTVSLRSEITGRVCSTFNITELIEIRSLLTSDEISIKKKKTFICNEIEFLLRLYNFINKDNKIWFIKNI